VHARQLDLGIGTPRLADLSEREQLRMAYEQCPGLKIQATFEESLRHDLTRRCLRGLVLAMLRRDEERRR
jgi:hypothetical protein